MSRDPRIDAYIAKAPDFARPILEKVRERVHAVIPEVEEAMKWSHPTYLRNGKIVLGTAAFKAHAASISGADRSSALTGRRGNGPARQAHLRR